MTDQGVVIGVDFGTDSVRSVIIAAATGETLAGAESGYPRWLEKRFQDPERHFFRQHPRDYLEAFRHCLCRALDNTEHEVRRRVAALVVDATGSTPAPVDRAGTPLALLPGFAENPDAMFYLWKDHTAMAEAVELNQALSDFEGVDYTRYQGAYASEWYWAKILHCRRSAPAVAEAAAAWVELCDWIPAVLTGRTTPGELVRSACAAGHKALWHSAWGGLPDRRCLAGVDPYLGRIHAFFNGPPQPAGTVVGRITPHWAEILGIPETTVVGMGALDAHAGALGVGIRPGVMAVSIGTSTVNMLVESVENLAGKNLAHVCGQAEDSVLPGLVGLETSQAAFGDIFAWLRDFLMWPLDHVRLSSGTLVPGEMHRLRQALQEGIFEALAREANLPDPESALTALDWFNGRRYPHLNESLKAALTGLSLGSTPPAVYKALVLAAAFGQKRIMESLTAGGIEISEMIAVGGIPRKSPAITQVLADVLGFPIRVSSASQAAARGAAMAAAVAGGIFSALPAAQQGLCEGFSAVYLPNREKTAAYRKAYERYLQLGAFVENKQ